MNQDSLISKATLLSMNTEVRPLSSLPQTTIYLLRNAITELNSKMQFSLILNHKWFNHIPLYETQESVTTRQIHNNPRELNYPAMPQNQSKYIFSPVTQRYTNGQNRDDMMIDGWVNFRPRMLSRL